MVTKEENVFSRGLQSDHKSIPKIKSRYHASILFGLFFLNHSIVASELDSCDASLDIQRISAERSTVNQLFLLDLTCTLKSNTSLLLR